MGERSGDLAGHCNTLTLWMRKMFWFASQCMDGHYHVGKSQRYVVANTLQQQARNSVTSAECQRRDGPLSIERRIAYSIPDCLSQTLVPVAFLSKRPNFRLERNLLRRDEVVRKRSSCGVVLRGLPNLGRSATFPVC